ncbi:collagen alpha-1(III) chain-like [Lemur catta]|uniref:collagen alpha-1(III) chain-like n=1 Tax=Lemur catta TaxID=9447 RepID=UPI001E269CF3|nr:collagen alpha-1(III) chain-like [Lemur catta]
MFLSDVYLWNSDPFIHCLVKTINEFGPCSLAPILSISHALARYAPARSVHATGVTGFREAVLRAGSQPLTHAFFLQSREPGLGAPARPSPPGGRGLPALPGSAGPVRSGGEKKGGEGRGGKTAQAVPTAPRELAPSARGDQLGPEGRVPKEGRSEPQSGNANSALRPGPCLGEGNGSPCVSLTRLHQPAHPLEQPGVWKPEVHPRQGLQGHSGRGPSVSQPRPRHWAPALSFPPLCREVSLQPCKAPPSSPASAILELTLGPRRPSIRAAPARGAAKVPATSRSRKRVGQKRRSPLTPLPRRPPSGKPEPDRAGAHAQWAPSSPRPPA